MYRQVERGCCPFGPITVVPCVLSILALALSWVSSWNCSFYEITRHNATTTLKVGLWTVQDEWYYAVAPDSIYNSQANGPELTAAIGQMGSQQCVDWHNSYIGNQELDVWLSFARGFSMLAGVFGIMLVCLIWAFACWSPFCTPLPTWPWWNIFSICCLLESIATGFSFLAFGSAVCTESEACKIDWSAILCAFGVMFWFLAGAAIFIIDRNLPEDMTQRVPRRSALRRSRHGSTTQGARSTSSKNDDMTDYTSQNGDEETGGAHSESQSIAADADDQSVPRDISSDGAPPTAPIKSEQQNDLSQAVNQPVTVETVTDEDLLQ